MAQRIALSWSGGKDAALALSRLHADPDVDVVELVVSVDAVTDAATVHEVPLPLLEAQAASLELPLMVVRVPGPGLTGYADAMARTARDLHARGVSGLAFGDLVGSGARPHREAVVGAAGLAVLEPNEDLTSAEAVTHLLAAGWRAVTVVVDAGVLDESHLGVSVDDTFLATLPAGCDVAGELGEYHSFVHDGPLFRAPVPYRLGPLRSWCQEIGTTTGPRAWRYLARTPEPVAGPQDCPPAPVGPAPC